MLMRRSGIPITYVVFDVLRLNGRDLNRAPYSERRAQLEALNLNSVYSQTPETFEDGQALFEAVCAHELEGVVAKGAPAATCPVSAAGSRSRTGTTGATRWSVRGRSTSVALNSSSDCCFARRGAWVPTATM
jgi:bifunctional non-homologous end joining protein LigD